MSSQPHRVTSGLFTISNRAQVEYKYKTSRLHKHKPYKHNPKVNPFGIGLVKKKRQIKLGEAGTIDRFGLVFQYQMKKIIKKNGKKTQLQIKNII